MKAGGGGWTEKLSRGCFLIKIVREDVTERVAVAKKSSSYLRAKIMCDWVLPSQNSMQDVGLRQPSAASSELDNSFSDGTSLTRPKHSSSALDSGAASYPPALSQILTRFACLC